MMGSKGPVDHCKKHARHAPFMESKIDFTWPNNKFVELLLMKVASGKHGQELDKCKGVKTEPTHFP